MGGQGWAGMDTAQFGGREQERETGSSPGLWAKEQRWPQRDGRSGGFCSVYAEAVLARAETAEPGQGWIPSWLCRRARGAPGR